MAEEVKEVVTLEKKTEVKVQKKKMKLPNFVKNKYFIFGATVFFFAVAFFLLILMDDENVVKPQWMFVSFFRDLFAAFGLKPFNVYIMTWFLLSLIFGIFFVVYFVCMTHKKMLNKHCLNYKNKHGVELTDKQIRHWNGWYYGISFGLLAAGIAVVTALWPYKWMHWEKVGSNFINLMQAMGILILFIAIVPIALLIIILVVRLFVFLLGWIVSAIAGVVMGSENYQKNKAIIEASTENASGILNGNKGEGAGNYTRGKRLTGIFPTCEKIDADNAEAIEEKKEEVELTYKQIRSFTSEFQSYLCHRELYYDIDLLRTFIAGLASSRLILLQGVSGTGKSTLPRVFMEYLKCKADFFPVQATWRDRSDVLGYMDIFSQQYKESELLAKIYNASYHPNDINVLVLDEMNISRVEYYFADFLSIFEYPTEDWLIPLIQPEKGMVLPKKFEGGKVRVPTNVWFVGTINIDESTFAISDKVYDRSIVINFNKVNKAFTSDVLYEEKSISINQLERAFEKCKKAEEYCLNKKEEQEFDALCNYACEVLSINYGNRILNQIVNFVPVFVGLGGSKKHALDLMFANKILRKVEGRYDNYVRDGLVKVHRYITNNFGNANFPKSLATISKYIKRIS